MITGNECADCGVPLHRGVPGGPEIDTEYTSEEDDRYLCYRCTCIEDSDLRSVIARVASDNGTHMGWLFDCPGCECSHMFDGRWAFNRNRVRPTFTPSLLVRGVVSAENDPTPTRCHSYVTNGEIRFLDDCTHKLAGQTVPLEPIS